VSHFKINIETYELENRYLIISLFSLAIQIALFFFYLTSSAFSEFDLPIDLVLAQLALGVVLLLIPDLVYFRWKHGVAIITISLLVLLVAIGWFCSHSPIIEKLIPKIIWVYPIVGISVLGFYLQKLVRHVKYREIILTVLLAGVFGIYVSSVCWGTGYHSPFFTERILLGIAHVDTLFHAAITNLFQTYGYPSIGLDGALKLKYHAGSHLVFGSLAGITNIHVLGFYNISYPVIFIPLYFKAILLLTLQITTSNSLNWNPFLSYMGIAICWLSLPWPLDMHPFVSESNLLALTVAIFFGSIVVEYKYRYWIPLLYFLIILLIFFLKISVGAIVFGSISYLIVRAGLIKKPLIYCQYIIYFLVTIWLLLKFVYPPSIPRAPSNIEFLTSHYKMLANIFQYTRPTALTFLPMLILGVFVHLRYAPANLIGVKALSRNSIWIMWEVTVIVAILSLVFSAYVWMQPSDATYFLSTNLFLVIPAMLVVFQQLLSDHHSTFVKNGVYLILFSSIFVSLISHAELAQKHYANIKQQKEVNLSLGSKKRVDQINLLNKFKLLNKKSWEQKKETVIYIPKTNKLYWEMFKNPSRSEFLAQSLSGIAMIGGQLDRFFIDKEQPYPNYGLYQYQKESYIHSTKVAADEARRLGYKKMIEIRYVKGKLTSSEILL